MSITQERPTLLIECLAHTISFLQFNQVPTLCSLLRVNKALFELTAPILYQNPFLLVLNHRTWPEAEKTERLVFLLRLFLKELDPNLVAELPPLVIYDFEDEDNEEDGYKDENGQDNIDAVNQERHRTYASQIGSGYFYHYRKLDHSFLASGAISQLFGTSTRIQNQSILAQLDSIFLRHCGSRASSLCLSSIRVQQFVGFIPMLGCLKRLEIHHIKRVTPQVLSELVEWIKEHDRVHGTLRELQIGGLTGLMDMEISDQSSLKELVQLPQAFRTLRALDTRSWREAWSMIDSIPVEGLDRLVMDYGEGQTTKDTTSFLLRCRSLKVLDLFIPGPDTFQGIAKLYGARFMDQHQGSVSEKRSIGQAEQFHIPSVERLYISGNHLNLRNALDDAAVGFCQSLRVLKATSMVRQSVPKPTLTWGRPLLQIHMPFLQELQLQGDIALEFHFSLLRCCPNLIAFKLMANGEESCGRIDNPIEEILTLKKLQTLQLLGRWPLTVSFLQGIAHNLTGLKMLDLARCFGVKLDDVMEAVCGMEFLWRVGWEMNDEFDQEEEIKNKLSYWHERTPSIRVGFIHWDEFYA
ncbi:hypothetical protein BX616_001412 [Lobosporangium transversale]|uniref:F-box domain-containing protein n=1 Tax=Lobosporangium transversale TaxID=64571 RepID=A0A1Y2GV36_9FUNG|nr:hypothetical protein BCR41DRAFT_348734 [Lobosporangium transversale]KAF9904050.1 hypothetical protein BX616_001412 [Lobosporangium transversale]ORZ24924.1 hypothetical protein BCR41DRAFT_348734 [Lobosporangium transversale]|eukprot:XP_021883905.1 hypothetical protein BCR41DRAFT_348734 [Lobosporangium transversale]